MRVAVRAAVLLGLFVMVLAEPRAVRSRDVMSVDLRGRRLRFDLRRRHRSALRYVAETVRQRKPAERRSRA